MRCCTAERLFYNRRVPLPLSLAEVEARLAGKYYRQLAAVVHDLQVIAENAVMFNGADSGIAQDAKGPRCHTLTSVRVKASRSCQRL